jgi:hypothetical protein
MFKEKIREIINGCGQKFSDKNDNYTCGKMQYPDYIIKLCPSCQAKLKTAVEFLQMTKEECEEIENSFKVGIKGCGKRTGYFEGSPYYCGEMVQTTPCDGFESYCKKCLPKAKEAYQRFDLVVIPAREKLKLIDEALKEAGDKI